LDKKKKEALQNNIVFNPVSNNLNAINPNNFNQINNNIKQNNNSNHKRVSSSPKIPVKIEPIKSFIYQPLIG
jgi:hypothetical protein